MTRRRFLALLALVAGGTAAVALVPWRRLGGRGRALLSHALRPALDPTVPTGRLAEAELATLASFAEVLVAGEALTAEALHPVRTALEEAAAERPGFRALCAETCRLLDALAPGGFAAAPVATRVRLVAAARLGEFPVGRVELLRWWQRDAHAVRDLLVPDLVGAYYDSPAGWGEVGYRAWPGVCGDPRAYTRPPS